MSCRRFTVNEIPGDGGRSGWGIDDGTGSVAVLSTEVEALTTAIELAEDHCVACAETAEVVVVSRGHETVTVRFELIDGVATRVQLRARAS